MSFTSKYVSFSEKGRKIFECLLMSLYSEMLLIKPRKFSIDNLTF